MSPTMSFGQYLATQFTPAQYIDFALRLIVASLCGAAIGIERARRLKEAGIRTHVIVCCAAALTMIVSKYAFADLVTVDGVMMVGSRGTDPSRIAAQTISGISFLGAGVIFKEGSSVHGLTTAAGIWATAGIGLAVGSGMYKLGIIATVLITLCQLLMHRFTVGSDALCTTRLQFTTRDTTGFWDRFSGYLHMNKIVVLKTEIVRHSGGTMTYDVVVRTDHPITMEQMSDFVATDDSVESASCTPI